MAVKSQVCVVVGPRCKQEPQAVTVHCGCCRSLFVIQRTDRYFRSASLKGGVLAQLSLPEGAEGGLEVGRRWLFGGGHHTLRRKGKEVAKPGSNGSAVASGKGEEKRAEKTDRFGVVRCQRLARITGVLLRSSDVQAHGGNEGGMQHASGGIDRIW